MQQGGEQPPFVSLDSYEDINAIREKFASLSIINQNHKFDNLDKSRYFIIRTQGEDNVHRAMKYGIWTSSSRKNERLNDAFNNVKDLQGDVYLFFTEINSMCFSGMAKLTSDFDYKSHFKYWLIENKWFGQFKIKWLYIKDLPFKLFEDIKQIQKLEGSDETLKSVYDLIDCTELAAENGLKMTKIFKEEDSKKSLFEDFPQLDKLEYDGRMERTNNQRFDRKFKELATVFETIPFSFSVTSYERKKMQRKQQAPYYQQQYYYNQPYGYNNYQQQFPGYQFQQTPQYWQANNGFYQNQYYPQKQQRDYPQQQYQQQQQNYQSKDYQHKEQYSQKDNNYQQQQQQQQYQDDGQVVNQQGQQGQDYQNVPLEQRFQFKNNQKRTKIDKKKRNNNPKMEAQYVQKQAVDDLVEQKN